MKHLTRVVSAIFTVVLMALLLQAAAPLVLAAENAPIAPAMYEAPFAPAQATTCDSCADCTAKLAASAPYSEVVLTADLLGVLDRLCIDFSGQSNLVFDCNDRTIDGDETVMDPDPHYGISVTGDNNEVRNCVVSDFDAGIRLAGSGHRVDNNEVTTNGAGIHLHSSSDNTILYNESRDNVFGIRFTYESNNNIVNLNSFCGNSALDIDVAPVGPPNTGNSGYRNSCELAGAWNDIVTTGCTYDCPVTIAADIGGNVADADGDGLGDNHNDMSGAPPRLIFAGVDSSGGPGSNGTMRTQFEWNLEFLNRLERIGSANVVLHTDKGTIDSLETEFHHGIGDQDGILADTDFEASAEPVPGVAMPVVDGQSEFVFDVTDYLRADLESGNGYFSIQGRVDEALAGSGLKRGLQVRSTATTNAEELHPQLIVSSASTCYPTLPAPQLRIKEVAYTTTHTVHRLTIVNRSEFPDRLFEAAPHLPPCDGSTDAARTWVTIFDNNDDHIFGFCAYDEAEDLGSLRFSVPNTDTLPDSVYVVLNDRECELLYTSNLAPISADLQTVTGATIAGNVADADGDGMGDNHNPLPGSSPVLINAAVDSSGGPGSNGVMRMQFEWDLVGARMVERIQSATVRLHTDKGPVDSLDTTFYHVKDDQDGLLNDDDFEALTEPIPGVAMPVVAGQNIFAFDVTDFLRGDLDGGNSYFSIQGRVDESLAGSGNKRGLRVYSTATSNLDELHPQLVIDYGFRSFLPLIMSEP